MVENEVSGVQPPCHYCGTHHRTVNQRRKVAKRIRKAKLFVFLRQIRHALFDAEFQTELATVFKDSTVGLCPVAPTTSTDNHSASIYGVSDDEAMEAIEMDRRWQLVLDCLDCEQPPLGKEHW